MAAEGESFATDDVRRIAQTFVDERAARKPQQA
jgi:hypothetical protein